MCERNEKIEKVTGSRDDKLILRLRFWHQNRIVIPTRSVAKWRDLLFLQVVDNCRALGTQSAKPQPSPRDIYGTDVIGSWLSRSSKRAEFLVRPFFPHAVKEMITDTNWKSQLPG